MSPVTDQKNVALQTIFSFFLGLMVVALVGIGTNTFLPSPAEKYDKRIQELSRELESYNIKTFAQNGLSSAEQAEYDAIQDEIAQLSEASQLETEEWARITSIILVIFATAVMSISLIRSEQLKVLSNGLLLGGIFTMVYGAGWAVFSGSSPIRLGVIIFALIVTIGLGYLKFVRGHKKTEQLVAGQQAVSGQGLLPAETEELLIRIKAIEERLDAAATAFSSKSREGKSDAQNSK